MNDNISPVDAFELEVKCLARNNDTSMVHELIFNKYPEIKIEEKEQKLFLYSYTLFIMFPKLDKLIKHLIFNYKISEENSIKLIKNKSQKIAKVQEMFEIRNLQEQLNNELEANALQSKKIKL